jgi:hypothetical protein
MLSINGKSLAKLTASSNSTFSGGNKSSTIKGGKAPLKPISPTRTRSYKLKKKVQTSPPIEVTRESNTRADNLVALAISITQEAEKRLSDSDVFGGEEVCIHFNHYKKNFPLHNRVLRWNDIDADYCISFVYKGDFKRAVYFLSADSGDSRHYVRIDETSSYFLDIDPSAPVKYFLEVIEDPVAGIGVDGLTLRPGPIKVVTTSSKQLQSGNRAFRDISASLRDTSVGELASAEVKDLLERRDIEDILYTGF